MATSERRQTSFLAFVFLYVQRYLSYHLLFHPKSDLSKIKGIFPIHFDNFFINLFFPFYPPISLALIFIDNNTIFLV